MEYQKKILGIIFIIAGVLVVVFLSLVSAILLAIPLAPITPPATDMPGFFKIISLAGSIMVVLMLALPSIIVGIGLVRKKLWANDLILPMGCFYLLFFPLGTAIGIYGLVVFFSNRQYKNTSHHEFHTTSTVH